MRTANNRKYCPKERRRNIIHSIYKKDAETKEISTKERRIDLIPFL